MRTAINVALIAGGLALIAGGAAFVLAVWGMLFVSESNLGGPTVIVAIGVGLVATALGIIVIATTVAKQRVSGGKPTRRRRRGHTQRGPR